MSCALKKITVVALLMSNPIYGLEACLRNAMNKLTNITKSK